jgi:hypothetical protein
MIYKKTKKYSCNELLTNIIKTKRNYNQNKVNHYINHSGGGGNTLGNKLFGTAISSNNIKYDRFAIANKEQYNQLKRDVRATQSYTYFRIFF